MAAVSEKKVMAAIEKKKAEVSGKSRIAYVGSYAGTCLSFREIEMVMNAYDFHCTPVGKLEGQKYRNFLAMEGGPVTGEDGGFINDNWFLTQKSRWDFGRYNPYSILHASSVPTRWKGAGNGGFAWTWQWESDSSQRSFPDKVDTLVYILRNCQNICLYLQADYPEPKKMLLALLTEALRKAATDLPIRYHQQEEEERWMLFHRLEQGKEGPWHDVILMYVAESVCEEAYDNHIEGRKSDKWTTYEKEGLGTLFRYASYLPLLPLESPGFIGRIRLMEFTERGSASGKWPMLETVTVADFQSVPHCQYVLQEILAKDRRAEKEKPGQPRRRQSDRAG